MLFGKKQGTHIEGLDVTSGGTFPVEVTQRRRVGANRSVPLKARVDMATGEVSFYVEPDGLKRLGG